MPDWTLHQWLVVVIAAVTAVIAMMAFITALFAWLRPKHPKSDPSREIKRFEAYQVKEFPAIHATSGVPILPQLLEGMGLDARKLGLARRFYDSGLAQFNHYVNNRDGMIEEWRSQMANLVGSLSQTETCKAGGIGKSLAAIEDCEQAEEAQAQYRDLSPQAQIYAQLKRHETEAVRSIVRDLETNTPRTDYTSVKARITSGNMKLYSILSELPVIWQDIRTLNERAERPKIKGKPPKRERLHVQIMMRDRGLLEDKHAERDGDWIISDNPLMIPYQAPVPTFVQLEEGATSGSEWRSSYHHSRSRQ